MKYFLHSENNESMVFDNEDDMVKYIIQNFLCEHCKKELFDGKRDTFCFMTGKLTVQKITSYRDTICGSSIVITTKG